VCACSLEVQWYPMLHQRRAGQQGEGGDCQPLLCLREAPSEVLGPGLGPPTQERCEDAGGVPEGDHEDDSKAGAPSL